MLNNQLRIIGGKWRGRKIKFPDIEGLRPTPDRVRETLFNWLSPVIIGAKCLDLFAGSGALGFEALSRGASKTVFVDSNNLVTQQLQYNQQLFQCSDIEIHKMSAEQYLQTTEKSFDIIFLDPTLKTIRDFHFLAMPILYAKDIRIHLHSCLI